MWNSTGASGLRSQGLRKEVHLILELPRCLRGGLLPGLWLDRPGHQLNLFISLNYRLFLTFFFSIFRASASAKTHGPAASRLAAMPPLATPGHTTVSQLLGRSVEMSASPARYRSSPAHHCSMCSFELRCLKVGFIRAEGAGRSLRFVRGGRRGVSVPQALTGSFPSGGCSHER